MSITDHMRASADGAITMHAFETFGVDGARLAQRVLDAVRSIFRYVPCEWLTDEFVVFATVDDLPVLNGAPAAAVTPQNVGAGMFTAALVELHPDDTLWALVGQCPAGSVVDPARTVAYRFRYGEFEDLVAGAAVALPNPAGLPSALSPDAFHDLENALQHFALLRGRSDCHSLAQAWRDDARLAFVEGPEHFMRDSLVAYLRDTLRRHRVTVLPEQNVNEERPVDVKVSWTEFSRHALLEVKWLGKSAPAGATTWGTTYSAGRAVTGAQQLCDYLDEHHLRVLDPTSGYLLAFDARRWALHPTDTTLDVQKALHYQHKEIEYPQHLLDRIDFGRPVRVFLEPRV